MAPFSVAEAVREISICRPSSVSVVEMAIERASAEAALCRGPSRSLHARQQEEEKDFSPWRRSEEEGTWRASDASALDAEEAKENDSLADDPLQGDSCDAVMDRNHFFNLINTNGERQIHIVAHYIIHDSNCFHYFWNFNLV